MATLRVCSIEGCGKPAYRRGMCPPHYYRVKTYGDPHAGKRHRASREEREAWIASALLSKTDNCIDWPFAKTGNGYGHAVHNGVETSGHRIVCLAAHGNPPSPDFDAAHSCHNRLCCNPRHLRWATKAENQADRFAAGTASIGERNHFAKLTASDVREIRRLAGVVSQHELARRFGTTNKNISAIHRRISWRHVD